MKREISNEQFHTISLFFFFSGLTIATIFTFLFFNEYSSFGKIASVVLLLVLGLLSWYFATRFYKVSFDSDYVYLSRFGRSQKIGLEKVDEVTPWIFPFEIFYLKAYIVTIVYQEVGIKKKIRFVSKGAFRNVGSIKGIPHFDNLKQFILDKKYGR